MTRDDLTNLLISLEQRVPVLIVDLEAAEGRGDHAAVAYRHSVRAMRDEVRDAIAEVQQGNPVAAIARIPVPA